MRRDDLAMFWEVKKLFSESKAFQFFELQFENDASLMNHLEPSEGVLVLKSIPEDGGIPVQGRKRKKMDYNGSLLSVGDSVFAVNGRFCATLSLDELRKFISNFPPPFAVTLLRFNAEKLPPGIAPKRPPTAVQKCSVETCQKYNAGKGFCKAHGGGVRCTVKSCTKAAKSGGLCKAHGGGKRCIYPGCKTAAKEPSDYCCHHGGGKRCKHPSGCTKNCASGTNFCIKHGGGKRCEVEGCTTAAVSANRCIKHGGGTRCNEPNCNRVARGVGGKCIKHGGGIRCTVEGCTKPALRRGLKKNEGENRCYEHGGGKRCIRENCDRLAVGFDFCVAHGGGTRCEYPDCKRTARSTKERRCWRHLRNKKICSVEYCTTTAKVKGYCKKHCSELLPQEAQSENTKFVMQNGQKSLDAYECQDCGRLFRNEIVYLQHCNEHHGNGWEKKDALHPITEENTEVQESTM